MGWGKKIMLGLNLVVRWSFDVIVWSRFSCSLWVVCCVRCVVLVCVVLVL